jgi:hypothetical protein
MLEDLQKRASDNELQNLPTYLARKTIVSQHD